MTHTYDDISPGETVEHPATGQEVAIIEERDHLPAPASILPSAREWEATIAMANQIAATPFVPESYRGQPEAVVAAILTGREMGIGPMQALRQIHMIDGRPAFAADLMLARMRQGGVVIVESDVNDDRAWIHARRSDTGEEAEVEWTYEEAQGISRKGKPLTDGANWKNYRQDMLWARCVGRLARRLASDLLGGLVYAAEEVRDMEPEKGGYSARTERKVNPAQQLAPGAIDVKGQSDADDLFAAAAGMGVSEDEAFGLGEAAEGKPRGEWGAPEYGRFWRRFANAIVKADTLAGGSDLGPTIEQIEEAYGWAFDGNVPIIETAAGAAESVVDAETADIKGDGPDAPEGPAEAATDGEEAGS